MFFPWTIFIVNIILAIFQFLMICAVSALLSIYARYGDEYSQSVRWSRQGGYYEMVKTLYNSRRNAPTRVKLIMVSTIIVSLGAALLDKGAAHYIVPMSRFSKPNSTVIITEQYRVQGLEQSFLGWSGTVRYGESVSDAMASMINNTRNIPGAIPGYLYTTQLSPYLVACEQMNLVLFEAAGINPNLVLTKGGCLDVNFILSGFVANSREAIANATVVQRSANQWSIVLPGDHNIAGMFPRLRIVFQNVPCSIEELALPYDLTPDESGMDHIPTTITTKCVHPSGDISVISLTTARFTTRSIKLFGKAVDGFFNNTSNPFRNMDARIQNIIKQFGVGSRPLVMETQISGTSIDALICTFGYVESAPRPRCLYINIDMLVAKLSENNTDIISARNGLPFDVYDYRWDTGYRTFGSTKAFTIDHIPLRKNSTGSLFSILKLQEETHNVAQLMASLGQNFYTDYNQNQLYVVYNIAVPEPGLDIPLWLLVLIILIMMTCLCLWVATEYFLDQQYTCSLYSAISRQIAPQTNTRAPALMPARAEPVEFVGFGIFPTEKDIEMESRESSKALLDSIQFAEEGPFGDKNVHDRHID
ncbi:hypothetical protein BX616_010568 [Lobosporangium transversale]|uniref:Uncharacterized protein n=1 Tax=Lobosporangium transversale TaxID=64571 RepID=A0A1Y2GPN0_9FUNG|nr:hypothetical protein BCR41DRAFT_370022 [Lobosporangium transversale]KAF9911476.1 hypothetical protein BX616_010568 [Lobosporangium transversale]ORZ18208.1 hypothetical protein BCR41DRAFT_370022 [Lobosporangium transversale]|eukprot:XP_021882003.1 hypothetical protein BCR41DRAFT_370022 [Lobosporangium transversale]